MTRELGKLIGFIGKQSAFENYSYESLVCGGFFRGLYYVKNGYRSVEKVLNLGNRRMKITFWVLRKFLLKVWINGKIT